MFAMCIVGIQALVPITSKLQAGYVRPNRRRALAVMGATEPKIGQKAPASQGLVPKKTEVVVLTDCGECSINYPTTREFIKGVDSIVLLAPKPEDHAAKELALAYQADLRQLSDDEIRSLNVVFVPRMYVFDNNRKLIYLQEHPDEWHTVLKEFYAKGR